MFSKAKVKKLPFDRYDLYSKAVQSPEGDVRFYQSVYKNVRNKKKPTTLREDFCAAGAISCEWVKLNSSYKAIGIDLDEEPMRYGNEKFISKLNASQKSRIKLIQKNVLDSSLPKADITVAVNFSYFFFKQRQMLKDYYVNVYKHLHKDGIFIVDIFGGTQCTHAIEDKTVHKGFTYYWDQRSFDPITNEAFFQIHFRYKGKKYEDVFHYDWRMWSIPEIKDLMLEAGFEETRVYWEGTGKNGTGNGVFTDRKKGEECESWIAYVVGIK